MNELITWTSRLEGLAQYFSTSILISAGLVGAVILIKDTFELAIPLPFTVGTERLILLTVATLAIGVGLERTGRFRRVDRQYRRIESLMASSLGGQHQRGYNEVYSSGARIVGKAQRSIKGLVFVRAPKAPPYWAEAVNNRLKESSKAGNPVYFQVVLAADFAQLEKNRSQFLRGVEERQKIYSRGGVGELVSRFLLDMNPPIGFDILIVDESHVTIGFTTVSGHKELQASILFEDRPEIASQFNSWFEQFILPPAVKYEDWAKGRARRLIPNPA